MHRLTRWSILAAPLLLISILPACSDGAHRAQQEAGCPEDPSSCPAEPPEQPPACPAETPDLCGSACVSLATDGANCGACGNVCGSGRTCTTGECVSNVTLGVPTGLTVPTLAYDDTSITLVWKKPADDTGVVDYAVYLDGARLGTAWANARATSPAAPYFDAFYAADTAGFHHRISIHRFLARGLSPATSYTFTVRSLDAQGNESADSASITQRTAPTFSNVVDIAVQGAIGDGSTVNTTVIQNAIDTCAASSSSAYGCKVLVPAGASSGSVFVTGALFLRSNMTVEIEAGATLEASSSSMDFPLSAGYQLYGYATDATDDRRPPSLLNALSPSHRNSTAGQRTGFDATRGAFSNIRVVGGGILDGNGWNRLADITDEAGRALPQYAAGSMATYPTLGVLARSQMAAAVAEFTSPDSSTISSLFSHRRSSLASFRGVRSMYFGGLTLRNPAYEGVVFLESEDVVFAGTTSQSYDVNNGAGVVFGNSDGVVAFDDFFDTGADDVRFNAGQGATYEDAHPMQNAWLFDNYVREGHGGLTLGPHTAAWIQDVLAEDEVMVHTDNGLRAKSTPATGGGARRVTLRDVAMKDVTTNAFVFTLQYVAGSNIFTNAASCAQFHDVAVRHVTLDNHGSSSTKAFLAVDGYAGNDSSLGYAETFQEHLTFEAVRITRARPSSVSRLRYSTFEDVTITDVTGGATPWVFTNSTDNTFTNVSPSP